MTSWNKALEYLKTASLRGSKLGLERTVQILDLLGNPQDRVKIIHIAGTNGKGSFGAMMSSVLTAAGYRTGAFSSPAITDTADSFRINGKEISHEILGNLICRISPLCESLEDKPTEFEVLTAAAFELFAEAKCDIALVECGMGGDMDSTNAVSSPLISVITNVQKDHCGFLGSTIEEIAAHKAGIIKQNRPVFFGGGSDNIPQPIIDAAKRKSAPLFTVDSGDLHSALSSAIYNISGTSFNYKGFCADIPLLGTYQPVNAVNVLSCVELLRNEGIDVPEKAVTEGISNAKWHGRFELLRKDPDVIFDGSHNPDGIKYAADSIKLYFPECKIALIIGVMADKEYNLYADMLGGLAERVFTVSPDNPRSLSSDILADTFVKKGIPAESFEILSEGVISAYEYARKRNIPLIALGSLYMYREFIEALGKHS